MPYRDLEKQREAKKERMRRDRGNTKVTQIEGNTGRVTHVTVERAGKLLLICKALDKETTGLGKRENMLDLVRYGVGGPLMREVKERLGGE